MMIERRKLTEKRLYTKDEQEWMAKADGNYKTKATALHSAIENRQFKGEVHPTYYARLCERYNIKDLIAKARGDGIPLTN